MTSEATDAALAAQLQSEEGLVQCNACTFLNRAGARTCEMCGQSLRGGGQQGSRRKKRSDASHLLNFEQARREEVRTVERRVEATAAARQASSRRSSSDKLRFLHDNLHFFSQQPVPPAPYDVDWPQVRAVRLVVHDMDGLRCPICLCDPTVPQMWQCGHVICLACALRYQADCDAGGRACRCPFCAELAEPRDMRSARIVLADRPRADGPSVNFVKPPAGPPRAFDGFAAALAPAPGRGPCSEVSGFDELFVAELAELAQGEEAAAAEAAEVAAAKAAKAAAATATADEPPSPAVAALLSPERPAARWGPPSAQRIWTVTDTLREGVPEPPAGGGAGGPTGGGSGGAERPRPEPKQSAELEEELRFLRMAREVVEHRRLP